MKVRFFLCTIIGVYQGDIVSFNSKNYCDGFNPHYALLALCFLIERLIFSINQIIYLFCLFFA